MTAPSKTVDAINQALDILENALEPLFAKSLHDTIENQDPLEQAKFCAMVPYIVSQLITIYLRTRGIDPDTHYVCTELERIKIYFHKIARAQDPNQSSMGSISDQTLKLDKDAANRFIRAALAEAIHNEDEEIKRPSRDGSTNLSHATRQRNAGEQLARPEGGIHTRSNDDESSDSESSLFPSRDEPPPVTGNPKEENKRKRPIIDPFTGYDGVLSKKTKRIHVAPSVVANEEASGIPKQAFQAIELQDSGSPAPAYARSSHASKSARKKAKKRARLQDSSSRDKTPATPNVMDSGRD